MPVITEERCIICGETEHGNALNHGTLKAGEPGSYENMPDPHAFLSPSKAVRVFEVTGFSVERSDRAFVEAIDDAAAFMALEEKLKADDYEGMTERSQWKATAAERPFLYIHWWS